MDQIPNTYDHLFWGYAAIWACLVVYVGLLVRSNRRVAAEVEELKAQLGLTGSSSR